MGKGRAAGVQPENHVVSGTAYGIAQTAVVCLESPFIRAKRVSNSYTPEKKSVPSVRQ